MIRKFCLMSFRTAMFSAGYIPKKDIADFACDCFMKHISNGKSVNLSRRICKLKAAEKFEL